MATSTASVVISGAGTVCSSLHSMVTWGQATQPGAATPPCRSINGDVTSLQGYDYGGMGPARHHCEVVVRSDIVMPTRRIFLAIMGLHAAMGSAATSLSIFSPPCMRTRHLDQSMQLQGGRHTLHLH